VRKLWRLQDKASGCLNSKSLGWNQLKEHEISCVLECAPVKIETMFPWNISTKKKSSTLVIYLDKEKLSHMTLLRFVPLGARFCSTMYFARR